MTGLSASPHTDPTVEGSGPVGAFITAFIDRDPLLRCAPAVFLTIEADDEGEDEQNGENKDRFDMNDRFSGSGAKGNGTAKVKDGQINLTIHGRDLIANHPYEVHLIVGPEGNPDLDLDNLTAVHVFPVTSNKLGSFPFKVRFDLGLAPGQYRLDYLVLHDLAAHDHDQDTFPTFLVLACAPASFVTI